MMLTAQELLAGSQLSFEVAIPREVLHPGKEPADEPTTTTVRLRPLTVQDLQLICRAAKESDTLMAALAVQRSLVEPKMSVPEVSTLHVGLLQFLLQQVNEISGISTTTQQIVTAAADPLVKAAFILAREFGWTPQQINELTLSQVLLHLQLLKEKA